MMKTQATFRHSVGDAVGARSRWITSQKKHFLHSSNVGRAEEILNFGEGDGGS